MARHYSSKDFFRQMPNALLGRYFSSKGLLAQLDFGAMKEGRPEPLFAAWAELPDEQRGAAEADFRDILNLSDKKGLGALIDEARFQFSGDPERLETFVATMSALQDHHARAMVAFLDHAACWKGAALFHHADGLGYWRKRKNLPRVPAAADKAAVLLLADRIKTYFRGAEGRGKNCVVEAYKRGDKDYFFAFPEDHAQRSIEWVDGVFDPRAHNPAFEIVFVYSQSQGTLDLNFRGNPKAIAALQGMFAEAILQTQELPTDPKDDRVYDLGLLAKPGFEFTHDVGSGIGTVVVRKLRLSSRVRRGDKITVEADGTGNRQAIYELLAQVGKSVPLHLYEVTQVDLAATVLVDASKPPRIVTFKITYPNSCTLKYDEIEHGLRQMLEASGIEPKAPTKDVGTALAPAPALAAAAA